MTQAQPEEDAVIVRARERIGTILQDKWKLESLLGLGGMAAVYAATHRNGKRVAVKMLHSEFSHDEHVRSRFLQEGYAANAIGHDGAVSVLDDDLAPDGSAFLVMELLDGETVEQRWETCGRRMPLADVLSITDQLLDVLAAAHAKNVVHRDIKPDNLFVTTAGVLKVLDFGIAKVFEREATKTTGTRAGTVMGTPAFMAPEQARGRWDEVDGRTDLWAVGATMFTLLSGRYVHEAESSHEQLIMSATIPAPALASVTSGVPAEVASIIERALEFERARRFPDAVTMQQSVRACLDGRTSASGLPMPQSGAVLSALARPESRPHEAQRLRAAITEVQQRVVTAKRRASDVDATIRAEAAERKALEQWFGRRAGTRTAAIDEARKEVRRHLVALARRALDDRATFGADFDTAREHLARLERAAQSAANDVVVHELALRSFDRPSLRRGLALIACVVVVVLATVAAPVAWRAAHSLDAAQPRSAPSAH